MKTPYYKPIFLTIFMASFLISNGQIPDKQIDQGKSKEGLAPGKSSKGLPSKEFELADRIRRDSIEKPLNIIRLIGVKPGMRIGEAGAGEGYFTFPLSEKVGEKGVIYANDISEFEISVMEHYAREFGVLKNIVSVLGKVDDPCFPVNDLDMIVIYHSFHDFEKRYEWIENAKKYLKRGGNLVIIDGYSPAHTDLTKEMVTEMGNKAGFRLLLYEKPTWHVHVFIKE